MILSWIHVCFMWHSRHSINWLRGVKMDFSSLIELLFASVIPGLPRAFSENIEKLRDPAWERGQILELHTHVHVHVSTDHAHNILHEYHVRALESVLSESVFRLSISTCFVSVSWPDLPCLSFLVTASQPTYVVVMNGSAVESERNLTGQGKGLDRVVTNGTPCDTQVCI